MAQDPSHRPDAEDEEPNLDEDDIIEVHEDEGDEPMDDDDEDNTGYDGEIIIGGPGPGEEEDMETIREDNSWGVSALHQSGQSTFSVSLHPLFPNPPLAVSGGEDDLAFIFCPIPPTPSSSTGFNADTFSPVKLTGHTDSVVSTGWSTNGELVATGGMDGRVRVWRRVKGRRGSDAEGGVPEWKDWEFLTSLETGSEIQWLAWHPKGNVLGAGCEDSSIWLWQLPSGNNLTVLASHTLPCTAGIFPPPLGRQLLTTSLDSSLVLWEISSSTPLFKISVFAPPNIPDVDPAVHGITTLAVSPNGTIAAVGGANGGVRLVSLPKGDIVGKLEGHREGESVEALVFVDLLQGAGGNKGVVLVSGGTDGKAFVWDTSTGRKRAELSHDEPVTSLYPHPAPHVYMITTASADSTLKTWDVRTGALIATHKGHEGVVNGVAVGPSPEGIREADEKGQVVVSAGDDGVSLIWRI